MTIPLMRNAFLKEEQTKKALANFILKAEKFSMAEQCAAFEDEFGKFQKRKHSILFNSGGSANLALLQALKNLGLLKEGDKIGFSALTWSTNTMPIIQLGFVPVAIDCEYATLNVSSSRLLERLEHVDLKAVFLTNVLGFVDDIHNIRDVCKDKGIILLEDNCESLGTETDYGMAGNFGLASTFSFFVAHHMSTIEGGMICTDDTDLSNMLKVVRANGWDRNLPGEQQRILRQQFGVESEFHAKYTFYDLGFNLRPTEITGFLGLYQLQFLSENILKRESNYLSIEKAIIKNDRLISLRHNHISVLSTFAFPIVCKDPEYRKELLERFTSAGIEIRPMIAGNMQRQPFYKKYVKMEYSLPNTDFIHNCGFYSGNYPELTKEDLELITNCLR